MYQMKTNEVHAEKRNAYRYPAEVDVIIFCEGEFVQRKTHDVSASGLRLHSPLPTKFKDKRLEIILADTDSKQHSFEMYYGFLIHDSFDRIQVKYSSSGHKPQLDSFLT